MSKETGGAAFPLPMGSETIEGCEGMQLRDYFAAKAMQALVPEALRQCEGLGADNPDENLGLAKASYAIADAMIAARGQ